VASYVLQYYAEANLVCREQAFGDPVKFTPDLFNPVCYSSPDLTDGIGGGGSNQSVYFADPNLKSAVETALGVTDPNSVDMLWLTELWAREGGISDLSGLEYALNLTDLDLGLNSIIDLNPLAGMSSLRLLHLDNNAISDIGPLSDIAALESLWLGSNQIEDINDLTNLMNLQFLDLSQNPLSRESCKTHIPQIIANNPGIDLVYDGCEFECILTLSSTAGGTVRRTRTISYFDSQPYHITEPAPDGVYTYNYGEEQTFYALPDDGCDFIGWSGTLVDAGKIDPSSSSVTFTIDSDYTLIANFEGALSGEGGLCALTVSSSEGGSIRQTSFLGASPVPDGIYTFPCGAELDFSPVPDEGYWFDSWTGTLLDAGKIPSASAWTSVHFTLDGDYTLIANFIPIPPVIGTLTVSVSSSGGGFIKGRYIRGTQWGCSDLMLPFDGKYECREGGSFNLVPYAHPEYHFVEWTGSAVDAGKVVPASPGVKVIGVDDDYTIVANFEAD
jgi:hypothetical protein